MKKQIITKERSLTKETEDLLNQQIDMEGKSSAYYLSMASWCDKWLFKTRKNEVEGLVEKYM